MKIKESLPIKVGKADVKTTRPVRNLSLKPHKVMGKKK